MKITFDPNSPEDVEQVRKLLDATSTTSEPDAGNDYRVYLEGARTLYPGRRPFALTFIEHAERDLGLRHQVWPSSRRVTLRRGDNWVVHVETSGRALLNLPATAADSVPHATPLPASYAGAGVAIDLESNDHVRAALNLVAQAVGAA